MTTCSPPAADSVTTARCHLPDGHHRSSHRDDAKFCGGDDLRPGVHDRLRVLRVLTAQASLSLLAMTMALAGCGAGEAPTPAAEDPAARWAMPTAIDPGAHYLIYAHGAIVETGGRRPSHPARGIYEYDAILAAFADAGFTVISEQRPAQAKPTEWGPRIANQVRTLLAAGVPPDQVAVVGFSKGAAIVARAASALGRDDIPFVLLAGCGPWVEQADAVVPRGRLLSVREASDDSVGSCETLFARAPVTSVTSERILELGGGHGAFYTPSSGWFETAVAWIRLDPPS